MMHDIPKQRLTQDFNAAGWCLAASVFSAGAVADVRRFLEGRQSLLHRRFETWSGESFNEQQRYAIHQRAIDEYAGRGLPADLRHYLTGEFDLESRLDTRIMDLLSSNECRAFLCDFLNSDHYYVHYPPMIRFKIAEAPANVVPLH